MSGTNATSGQVDERAARRRIFANIGDAVLTTLGVLLVCAGFVLAVATALMMRGAA